MTTTAIADWDTLDDRSPTSACIANVDLVIVRVDDTVSVLYGRCAHRGALMADGHVEGDNLICGVHGWDYRVDTGVSAYNNSETLPKFTAWIEDGRVCVDEDEIWRSRAVCRISPSYSYRPQQLAQAPSGASLAVSSAGREKKADNVSSRLMGTSGRDGHLVSSGIRTLRLCAWTCRLFGESVKAGGGDRRSRPPC